MAYDEKLADRVREVLAGRRGIEEKRMFGGIAFLARGHMFAGLAGGRLMLRVGPERYEAALARPHVREMDFTGRPLRGYVYVDPEGFRTRAALARWIGEGFAFVRSLPAKPKRGGA